MPWYKSGTVSVTQNSNAVIGTGTTFIANSRVGDGFRGPDGGWYEVTNIASNTALSISPNYQGPTNSAGGYAIAPLQGYVKDSADALRAIVNQYGAKLAALGTTGNYDTLPVSKGGTGSTTAAEARAALGIGSTGTYDTLPVSKGGTGATDTAGARAGLGLGTASTATIGNAAGNLMPIQAGAWNAPVGLGIPIVNDLFNLNGKSVEIGQYGLINGSYTPGAQSAYGIALALKGGVNEWRHILQFTTDGDVHDLSITNPSAGGAWRVAKFYTTLNTTRAADGTLKAI